MESKKRNIAIVCGGDSMEHEVSLRSAQGLYSWFDRERYNVNIVVMRGQDWHVKIGDDEQAQIDKNDFSFTHNGVKTTFDYAYITIHGTPGENGILQGYFDLIGMPYSTCSVLVESLTFNKYMLNNYLRSFNVTVPDSILLLKDVDRSITEDDIEAQLGIPCFVKPTDDGSSFGVTKVKDKSQLAPAIENAFKQFNQVMIEHYLDGIEVTVGCYKTRNKSVVFPITEVVTHNEFFDYNAKYNGEVEEITPARISPELTAALQAETSRIYDILHCNGIIRIDYIITKNPDGSDHINLLEINTTPGMTVTSFIPQQVRAAGLSLTDVLTDIIENQF